MVRADLPFTHTGVLSLPDKASITRRGLLFGMCALAQSRQDPTQGLPDYSSTGYRGGGVPLPDPPVRFELKPEAGDATSRIQAAIDKFAELPLEKRGALLLAKGEYAIAGTIRIQASGITLRGEGENRTVLRATGKTKRALIELRGPSAGVAGRASAILDETVAVGSRCVRVANPAAFRVGQVVLLRRVGNADWIREIGMDRISERPGKPGSTQQWVPFSLDFERKITAIDGNAITLDAPLFCAIDRSWGGGSLIPFDDSGRISNCSVERLTGVSDHDATVTALRNGKRYSADEEHAQELISVQNANDCWVRHVASRQFANCCVQLGRAVRQVTVEDCDNREMVSQITGGRRYPFSIASAQRCLIQRCFSESGRHDFVVGSRVPGPNVFLDCEAVNAFATSEPHHRWSTGGLYDNVKADIAIQDRQWYGSGHGWSGANYTVWNCSGEIVCQNPPTAENWVVGHIGRRTPGAFPPRPEAVWRSFGARVEPRSLYRHQLSSRLESSQ